MKINNKFLNNTFFILVIGLILLMQSCINRKVASDPILNDSYEKSIDTVVFIPYRKGDTWFYIDRRTRGPYAGHNKAFEGAWDRAYPFNKYYLAPVRKNGYEGYIDTTGKIIVPLIYKWVDQDFEDSIAIVQNENETYGAIHISGDTIIPFKYDLIGRPRYGLFNVRNKDGISNICNNKGKELLETNKYKKIYLRSWANENDLISFEIWGGGSLNDENYNGFMNKNLEIIVPPIYHYTKEIVNDRAVVEINGLTGFIDNAGKLVIPCIYNWAGNFAEKYACVQDTNDMFGLINKNGNVVLPFIYEDMGNSGCNKNSYLIAKKGDRWGVIRNTGEVLVDFQYEWINYPNYKYGLITIKEDNKYGVIDTLGNIVIPFEYDGDNGLPPLVVTPNRIVVSIGNNVGLINRKNEIIIPFEYERIGDFMDITENGLITIRSFDEETGERKYGYADIFGGLYFED